MVGGATGNVEGIVVMSSNVYSTILTPILVDTKT